MYASIRIYKTSSTAEVTRRVQKGFVPLIQNSPGFVAYYAIESAKDEWTSISIFETEANAQQANLMAADWVRKESISALTPRPKTLNGKTVIELKK